ncbi:hypothetical protein AMTR_s00022p00218300 [Amborella trichopoda]|uniref:Uncharacterized protein n=1 Tax=Amborella trichopoda TaxID=13333 RepID=W1PUE8_AMBTC|nr:hypothetical protein AMTR_s00022p00218300 [Amborella trichopoda]
MEPHNTSPQVFIKTLEDYVREISKFYREKMAFKLTSARQVPTGPDPLHHNHIPFEP